MFPSPFCQSFVHRPVLRLCAAVFIGFHQAKFLAITTAQRRVHCSDLRRRAGDLRRLTTDQHQDPLDANRLRPCFPCQTHKHRTVLSLQQADNSNKGTPKSAENDKYVRILEVLEEIRSEDGCFSLKDLAVNGNDLMQIGFSGRTIGLMLNWLLEQVMEENLPNDRSVLLAWAQQVWADAWQNS